MLPLLRRRCTMRRDGRGGRGFTQGCGSMKAARGHGPAERLKVGHHRLLHNAAKPKRKNHAGSSANMRIANALRQSAGH